MANCNVRTAWILCGICVLDSNVYVAETEVDYFPIHYILELTQTEIASLEFNYTREKVNQN